MALKILASILVLFVSFGAFAQKVKTKTNASRRPAAAKKVAPAKKTAPKKQVAPKRQVTPTVEKKAAPVEPTESETPKSAAPTSTKIAPSAEGTSSESVPERVTSRSYFFGSFSYAWWQENVDLIKPGNTKYTMYTSTHGTCVGGGYFKRIVTWDLSVSVCGFYGQTDVYLPQSSLRYAQKAVETYGAIFGPGIHFRPTPQLSLGLVGLGLVRHTNWTLPAQGWSVEPVTNITGAVALDAQWRIGRVVLHQRMGPIVNASWLWSLGLDLIL